MGIQLLAIQGAFDPGESCVTQEDIVVMIVPYKEGMRPR